jgi:hypothetical protein
MELGLRTGLYTGKEGKRVRGKQKVPTGKGRHRALV